MKRFYLTGHHTFSNRGCEAIVRSTVLMLNQTFGLVEVLVPSSDILRDQQQWPDASKYGVHFVRAYLPPYARYWVNFLRLPFKFLKKGFWPFPHPKYLLDDLKSVDAILSIGGDNYSLDYRLPSMLMGMDKLAIHLGKPVFLWGASVGPFEAEPYFVESIRKHLEKMAKIFVRESISYNYLTDQLGLKNVALMADPAFTLSKESVDTSSFWPKPSVKGVVGFNVSPLIERYRRKDQNLRLETVEFIKDIVARGYSVLLVPHVIPLDGSIKGNDAIYMASMLDELKSLNGSVNIMPTFLNASQIKDVISKLRFFIGARTHATIAALSSSVPTLSIAYSVKAQGINYDLLGQIPVVLNTSNIRNATLMEGLDFLILNEDMIKEKLNKQLPEWSNSVLSATNKLKNLLP